jgi:hypothetical protein
VYGDSVIIERQIRRDGASRRAEEHSDLVEILDLFNIQIDNPVRRAAPGVEQELPEGTGARSSVLQQGHAAQDRDHHHGAADGAAEEGASRARSASWMSSTCAWTRRDQVGSAGYLVYRGQARQSLGATSAMFRPPFCPD